MNLRNFSLLAILAALALLAWYTTRQAPESDNTESIDPDIETASVADIEANNVQLRQLRADGSLHYSLNAQTIRQFTENELTRMILPYLQLFNPTQPPWDVRAKHGYIRKAESQSGAREDVLFLREEVVLKQEHPENGLITMRSDTFYVYPDRQYAETDQGVIIDTQVGRTRAAGMKADLETGLLNLTSVGQPTTTNGSEGKQRVHTIVLPEQFKQQS